MYANESISAHLNRVRLAEPPFRATWRRRGAISSVRPYEQHGKKQNKISGETNSGRHESRLRIVIWSSRLSSGLANLAGFRRVPGG